MSLSTSIPPYGDHVVAPRETDLEDILSIGKEEARRRERKICSSSNSDDADLGGHDSSEAFFVVDVGCIQRKYHRWRQCFPRIKPFYGKLLFSFMHALFFISMCNTFELRMV